MIQPPFKLLTVHLATPIELLSCPGIVAYAASFRHPDASSDEELTGFPSLIKAEAIHNLFEAACGRTLVRPYNQHFLPLADATLDLCYAFSMVLQHDGPLYDTLRAHIARKQPLPDEHTTISTVYATIDAVRETVWQVHRVVDLLAKHAADPAAKAMRTHPLTSYAAAMLVGAMGYCRVVASALGMDGAIRMLRPENTPDKRLAVIADFDPTPDCVLYADNGILAQKPVERWSTEQTRLWYGEKEARLRCFGKWLGVIMAPDSLAARSDRMMFGEATLH
jgi:hypothetical protein